MDSTFDTVPRSIIYHCSYSSWYSKFKYCTINSEIIPLSKEVVAYLLSDGIVLPVSSKHGVTYKRRRNPNDKFDIDSDDDDIEWDEEGESAEPPVFAELEKKVNEAITRLGGKVFPKLNWSSPKDASWIATGNTLQCTSFSDILLLLKSSDFITHDLTEPFKCCKKEDTANDVQYELCLKEWQDFYPSGEFRCFVTSHVLVGISQRKHQIYFPFMLGQKEEIISHIERFFNQNIKGKFHDSNYTFDVYVNPQGDVTLVDFNPFCVMTDCLLFNWDEIFDINKKLLEDGADKSRLPEFRFVEDEGGVQPSEFRDFAIPRDFVDLSRGEDPEKFIDFMNLHSLVVQDETVSSSDEE